MAYEATFKHEILNEVIASTDALIFRTYQTNPPPDIAQLDEELWDIYRKLPFEEDLAVLDAYDKRLTEIRRYVKERAGIGAKKATG